MSSIAMIFTDMSLAACRLNHLRRSNADLERHLKSVDRQTLNAQRAVQQLVA